MRNTKSLRWTSCALLASACALTSAACSGSDGSTVLAKPIDREPTDNDDPPPPPVFMRTEADPDNARAGDPLRVTCLREQDGRLSVPEFEVSLRVTPDPGALTVLGNEVELVPPTPGLYHVACVAADGSLADPVGLELTIAPRPTASWSVGVPEQTCFTRTDRLAVDIAVFDRDGNPIAEPPVIVHIRPTTGWVGELDTGIRFTRDGEYEVEILLIGELEAGTSIAPVRFTVLADATPPVIQFSYPTRGDMLTRGGFDDAVVEVGGFASDASSAITSLVVNGESMPGMGQPHETFETVVDSRWGLTVAWAQAEDACGNSAYATLPFLRAPSYYPATTTEDAGATIGAALEAQVSQPFVDDFDRGDLDDLATLAETGLGNLDYDTLLGPGEVLASAMVDSQSCDGFPGPTYISLGYSLERHPDPWRSLDMWGPFINAFYFVDGGLYFDLTAYDFNLPLRLVLQALECVVGATLDQDVTIDADVRFDSLDTWGVVGVDVYTGEAFADVQAIEFDIEGLELDIDCGAFDDACDAVIGFIFDISTGFIEWMVEKLVADKVPPMLEELLGDLALSRAIELPAPLSGTITAAAELERLTFCGPWVGFPTPADCHAGNWDPGSLSLGVATQIFPDRVGDSIPTWAEGSLRREGAAPLFDSSVTSFGVSIRDDLLNQALWALWYGGGLDIPDIASALGDSVPAGLDASLRAILPPVVMPGRDGTLVDLGLGGLEVEATVDVAALLGDGGAPYLVDVSATVSLVAGADFELDEATQSIKIRTDTTPEVYFEIHDLSSNADGLEYASFLGQELSRVLTEGLPRLLNQALGTIAIPKLDLSAVPGVSQGTAWALAEPSIGHDDGYVALSGSIGVAGAE